MDAPQLRRATAADVPAIKALVDAAYSHYLPRLDGRPPGPMFRDYAAEVRDHDAYVLDEAGRLVGVLVLHWLDDGLLLDNVAVHPDYQGRGLGRRLLEHAESEARRAGLESISLYTNVVMTENIAMYGRIGYVETDRHEDGGYTRVFMRKPLK